MVTVIGTNGNDTIIADSGDATVTNTTTTTFTGVTEIRGGRGDDSISVTDTFLADRVRAQAGDDTVEITNSTIDGQVNGQRGNDTIRIVDSSLFDVLAGAGGSDSIYVSGSDIGRVNLGSSNDTIAIFDSTVFGTVNGSSGTDLLILPENAEFTDDSTGLTVTVVAGTSYAGLTSGTVLLPNGEVFFYTNMENLQGVPCFTKGTHIAAPGGARRIETLKVGDLVCTQDHGAVPIRWIGQRTLSAAELALHPRLAPILIPKGALGEGLPQRDLQVSPQHRMLIRSRIAQRLFDVPEVLIPACKLAGHQGIAQQSLKQGVTYFHLLFDRHEILISEGTPSESLYPGPQALASLGQAACDELFTLFPTLRHSDQGLSPARPIVERGKHTRPLLRRHLKNAKPLVTAA